MNMDVMDRLIASLKTETEGLRFDMGEWANHDYGDNGEPCGTCACIAGHVIYNEDKSYFYAWLNSDGSVVRPGESIDTLAEKLLDIEKRQAQALFMPGDLIMADAERDDAIKMLEWFKANPNASWQEIRDQWDVIIYPPVKGVPA